MHGPRVPAASVLLSLSKSPQNDVCLPITLTSLSTDIQYGYCIHGLGVSFSNTFLLPELSVLSNSGCSSAIPRESWKTRELSRRVVTVDDF